MPEPKVLSLADFKSLVDREERPPKGALLRKQYIAEIKAADDDERGLIFSISTGAVDRDSDTIAVDGWKLANYRKNPVVLWAHRYMDLPVARATKVFTEEGKLKAIDHFAERDVYAFADTVFQMVKAGYLSATSVGFAPLKFERVDPDSDEARGRRGGVNFISQELLEHSIVPVPSNPEALIEARSALPAADWKAYTTEIERLIAEAHGTEMVIVPRATLEAAWRAVNPTVVMPVLETIKPRTVKDGDGDDEEEMTSCDAARHVQETLAAHHTEMAKMHAAAAAKLGKKSGTGDAAAADPDAGADAAAVGALLKSGFVVQTLVCPKKAWASLAAAKQWAADHRFKTDKTDTSENAWRFRQRDPGDFQRIRGICLNPGRNTPPSLDACKVIALGGPLKAAATITVEGVTDPELLEIAAAEYEGGHILSGDGLPPRTAGRLEPTEEPKPEWARDLDERLTAIASVLGGGDGKGVIAYKRTPLAPESTPWDAGAEVGAASVDDLRVMCAWYSGDGTRKGDYKLPHHHASGNHACVWRGVANAAARLANVSLPAADMPGVKKHLAAHYKDFGKEAPWKAAPEAWEAYEVAVRALKAARSDVTDADLAGILVAYGFPEEATALRQEVDLANAALSTLLDPFAPPPAKTVKLFEGLELTQEQLVKSASDSLPSVLEAAWRRAESAVTGRLPD